MGRHPDHPVRAGARATRARAADPRFDRGAFARPARRRRGGPRRLSRRRSSHMSRPPRARGERLDPGVFDLPVEKMREGYYTDAYFNHTRSALLADGRHPRVADAGVPAPQRDARRHGRGDRDPRALLARLGLRSTSGRSTTATAIEPWETVMTIEGDYTLFAHLETVYLGVLARRTLISTNAERGAAGREREADHLHAGTPRPSPCADGRRLRRLLAGAMSGTRSASPPTPGFLVGRSRRRHRPPLAHRRLRRRHRARSEEVRRMGAAQTSTSRSSSTSRTTR